MRRVTLDDVAEHAGVSRQTVSRAVNGKPEITPETRERVMAAVEELGYRPNRMAQSLVTRRSMTVGLVVADITNPFFPDLARGVQDEAEAHGYNVFVCNYRGDTVNEIPALRALAAQGADGVITFASGQYRDEFRRFADTFDPIVLINGEIEHPNVTHVRTDLVAGGVAAAEHLHEVGARCPAVLTWNEGIDDEPRVSSFLRRSAELGSPVPGTLIAETSPDTEHAADALADLLEARPDIDGVFTYNDVMAVGALQAVRATGRRVPDDVAVVGCDDLALSRLVTPPLTTIHMDRYQLGTVAMRHLLARLGATDDVEDGSNGSGTDDDRGSSAGGDAPDRVIMLPTRLVVRESTVRTST